MSINRLMWSLQGSEIMLFGAETGMVFFGTVRKCFFALVLEQKGNGEAFLKIIREQKGKRTLWQKIMKF
jgi:hypothetical protein